MYRHRESQHHPDSKRFCTIVDCQNISGENYQEDFKNTLRRCLAEENIIHSSRGARRPELFTEMRDWLAEDDQRSLELLLDESDKLIGQEAMNERDYPCIRELQTLHQSFPTRFRFILAGTHNALRMDRSLNTPFGHLGRDICVKPFDGEDRLVGIRLVTEPLAALGFVFTESTVSDKNDGALLPLEILATANFFPSIIQTYCEKLLVHLYKKSDWSGPPPYKISREDVREVAESRNVRDELKRKFNMTFDLDERYKLIAAILSERHYASNGIDQAMSKEEIREYCVMFAPQLFASREDYVIEAYLVELENLGILVRNDDNEYQLRSPNIAHYMGTHSEVNREIDRMGEAQPPEKIDQQLRRTLLEEAGFCSPLTARQISSLLRGETRIVVVVGSPACGIDEMKHMFETDYMLDRVTKIENFSESGANAARRIGIRFPKKSRKTQPGHKLEGLFIVDQSTPWDSEELTTLAQNIKGRSSRHGVLAIGGPNHAIQLAEASKSDSFSLIRIENVTLWSEQTLYLHALEIKQKSLAANTALRHEIITATGGVWPLIEDVVRELGDSSDTQDLAGIIAKHPLSALNSDELLARFGLGNDAKEFITDLFLQPLRRQDAQSLLSDKCPDYKSLRYFEWMGAVTINEKGLYKPNEYLANRLVSLSP